MKSTVSLSIPAVFLLLSLSPARAADEIAGVVKIARGETSIARAAGTVPARPGEKLFEGDTLKTGPDGALGVTLRDDSTLSLGPGSTLVLERFTFSPGEGKMGLLARMVHGTMAYLSGLIVKLSPESARFETPVATIGIRGTRFAVEVD